MEIFGSVAMIRNRAKMLPMLLDRYEACEYHVIIVQILCENEANSMRIPCQAAGVQPPSADARELLRDTRPLSGILIWKQKQ